MKAELVMGPSKLSTGVEVTSTYVDRKRGVTVIKWRIGEELLTSRVKHGPSYKADFEKWKEEFRVKATAHIEKNLAKPTDD